MPRLTDRSVEQAKPRATRHEIADAVMGGLYLIVQTNGRKSWATRYRFAGKSRKLTIGPYPRIGLAVARDKAGEALEAVDAGRDPQAEKRRGTSVEASVEAAAAIYLQDHVSTLRVGTRVHVVREMARICKAWHGRSIASIVRADVRDLIDAAVAAGWSRAGTLKYVRGFLAWCEAEDKIASNPARGVRRPVKAVPRQHVLDDAELAAVWHAGGPYWRLLILTGCRRQEIGALEWSEVKADAIELPASRTKMNSPLWVPLTDAMRTVLAGCPKTGRYVITGTNKPALTNGAAKTTLGLSLGDWRIHDIRRSVATGCARLGVSIPVIERMLNHRGGSFAGIVSTYNTFEYRAEVKAALELWSAHVESITRSASPSALAS
jgi:integrase